MVVEHEYLYFWLNVEMVFSCCLLMFVMHSPQMKGELIDVDELYGTETTR